jgi:hypothetical protein
MANPNLWKGKRAEHQTNRWQLRVLTEPDKRGKVCCMDLDREIYRICSIDWLKVERKTNGGGSNGISTDDIVNGGA